MQIKKYLAPTLKEALKHLKNELGEDAIVLSTRVVVNEESPGMKKMYEVVAGVENKPKDDKPKAKLVDTLIQDNPQDTYEELRRMKERVFPISAKHKPTINVETRSIDKEKKHFVPAKIKELNDALLIKEIFPSIVNKITGQIKTQSEFITSGNVNDHLVSIIASMLHTSNFEVKKKKVPKIVTLVGPTGVGKTTCIAKLAVISKIFHKLDIGIITLDTFRLGAIDQLKIFSEISNIDLQVCYEQKELPKLLNKFKKKDLIFVDSAGRSQNNKESINEIKNFLTQINSDDVFLVLSATNSTRNLLDVITKFKPLNYNGIIYTKLDEAAAYGNILNVSSKVLTPIIFLTNGQVIPDDIIAADADYIAKVIFSRNITG